ncbi:MAG: hypothetical protein KAS71_04485 [Bacteroidales bacterium]|nr:hypothetical protein [Bacteroidales bacterium]
MTKHLTKKMENNIPKFTLNADKTSFTWRAVLIIVLLISIFIPITATVYMIEHMEGFKLGILFSYVIFWSSGFYIVRLFLWNTYGKEIIEINNDSIHYYVDYKLFKESAKSIKKNNFQIGIIKNKINPNAGKLYIKNDKNLIESTIEITNEQLNEVEKMILLSA